MSYSISEEEKDLIDCCMRHERRAQRLLYEKYKNAMYTAIFRLINNEDDAKEALQDGFIEVFKSMAGFQQKSSLGAWIKTIMLRSSLKKINKETIKEEELKQKYDYPVVWDENLTGELLDKAIRRLPEGYRSIFLLLEVEGFSHKEAAAMLGISEGTSKSQLYHSKQMLQKILKGHILD
jgi:RNA polymerase sigma factor (sigma-70 family)